MFISQVGVVSLPVFTINWWLNTLMVKLYNFRILPCFLCFHPHRSGHFLPETNFYSTMSNGVIWKAPKNNVRLLRQAYDFAPGFYFRKQLTDQEWNVKMMLGQKLAVTRLLYLPLHVVWHATLFSRLRTKIGRCVHVELFWQQLIFLLKRT